MLTEDYDVPENVFEYDRDLKKLNDLCGKINIQFEGKEFSLVDKADIPEEHSIHEINLD